LVPAVLWWARQQEPAVAELWVTPAEGKRAQGPERVRVQVRVQQQPQAREQVRDPFQSENTIKKSERNLLDSLLNARKISGTSHFATLAQDLLLETIAVGCGDEKRGRGQEWYQGENKKWGDPKKSHNRVS
jgi:hypothetical protein